MSRAQVIVHRGDRILLVKHRERGEEYWCLPGGGIEPGELPATAALRELAEECHVTGRIVRSTATVEYGLGDHHHTFLVDIDDQTPQLGHDPEYTRDGQILVDLAWLALDELSERDRAYLWTAGLLTVAPFAAELRTWTHSPAAATREDSAPAARVAEPFATIGRECLRRAIFDDLPGLLRLYRFLNPDDPVIDPQDEAVRQHWRHIVDDPRLRYFVVEPPSATLVSTCTLTLVPNLTRGLRPYGVMENVVTDPAHRGQGHATRLLRHALDDAWREGCYKVMLSTGSKRESTLRFYENAGFQRGAKTGFVAYPASDSI